MKKISRSISLFAVATISAAGISGLAHAQLPYAGSGQVHVENFNWTLGGTLQNLTWQQNVERQSWALEGTSQLGWYASFTNPPSSFSINNGTANTGGGMLSNFFYTSTEENRSLGGRPTAGAGPLILALRLRNMGTDVLSEFTISYALAVTQQRNANVNNTAIFAYRIDGAEEGWATASFTEPGANFNASTPLVNVASNVNGSSSANRGLVVNQTVTGLEWEPGQDLWLRWTVPNVAEGPNVALDDLVFIARNPEVLKPPPPGGVRVAQVGNTGIQVRWEDQLQDGEGYIIERSTNETEGFQEISRVAAGIATYTDNTTEVDITYFYRVRALRSGIVSDPSTVVSIARYVGPPAAPIDGSVRVVSSVSILLRWQDNAFNEQGFVVERSVNGGTFEEIVRVPSGILNYTDSPVIPETNYTYRIAAYNDLGLSDYLTVQPVETPPTPIQFGFGPRNIEENEIEQIVYVSADNGDNANSGLSEGQAVRTIERAVDVAKEFNAQNQGVKILIAPGVYLEGDPNRDVDFGAVNLNGFFVTSAPLIIEGQGWTPGVNTGDVIITGAERWSDWSAPDSNGVHSAAWPYNWGLNPRSQAVAPDVIKRFEMIWVQANGEWRNYIQMDNANDSRIQELEEEDGWFWINDNDGSINIRPQTGVDLNDPEVVVKVTLRKRLMHHWRPQTSTTDTPITVRNLVFEHAGDIGLYLQNMNGVILEDMDFRRNKIEGFTYGGGIGLRISRARFNENGVSGLGGSGRNMLIEDVEISRNGRLAVYSGYTGWANEGFKFGHASQMTIRRLLMEDNYGVQAWFDTGIYEAEMIDSVIRGGLTSGIFIENNNPANIPGLGVTPTVIIRNNVIYQHVTRSRFANLVARGVSISENYNALIENNLIVENDHGIALAANIRGQSFYNVVRRNVISTIGEGVARLYHPRNALIDWQEFFDSLDSKTNDNIYINARETAFTNRTGQPITFADWKNAQFNNPNNFRTDKAVDSRSIHLMEDYSGQEMISIRTLRDRITEGSGKVDAIEFTRLSRDLSSALEVPLSFASGPGFVSDADFTEPLPTSLVFPAGESKFILSLEAVADGIPEGDELLQVTVVPESTDVLVPLATATITVVDLDATGISQVTVDTPSALWFESDGVQTIRLRRTGSIVDEVTVDIQLSGTAVANVDYAVSSTTATFAAGENTAEWTIELLADELPAVDKTLVVSVRSSDDNLYTIGFPSTVTFTIRDENVFTLANDPNGYNPALLALGVNNPSSSAVSFDLRQSSTFYMVDHSSSDLFDLDDYALPANATTVVFNWLNTNDDGISNPLPIGFDFPFGGESYSTVRVHSNGFLTFTDLPDPSLPYRAPVDLPNSASNAPSAMLAPFWTDLGLDAQSSVRYGKVDPFTFVVEYRNVPKFPVLFTAQRVSFRVILRHNGTVYYQYQQSQYTGSMRAGYQNLDRTIGSNIATSASSITYPSTYRLTSTQWISPESSVLTIPAGETRQANWILKPWLLDYGIFEETVALINPESPFGDVDYTFQWDNRPFWMQAEMVADSAGWYYEDWTGYFNEVVRPWHFHYGFGWFLPISSTATSALVWSSDYGWVRLNEDWLGYGYVYQSAEWVKVSH